MCAQTEGATPRHTPATAVRGLCGFLFKESMMLGGEWLGDKKGIRGVIKSGFDQNTII